MPWNSCLFRKIYMPFTDTSMTQCLRFRERRQRGCGAGTVPAAMPPPSRRVRGRRHEEGVLSCTSFLSRPSSTRGRHVGPIGDVPQGSDCWPLRWPLRSSPSPSSGFLLPSQTWWEVREDWPLGLGADAGPVGIIGQMKTVTWPPLPQVEKLSGCEGGSLDTSVPGISQAEPQTSLRVWARTLPSCGRVPSALLPYSLRDLCTALTLSWPRCYRKWTVRPHEWNETKK